MKKLYISFRDSDTTIMWLLRIAIFIAIGIYGWLFVLRHITGNIHFSFLDSLKPYIENQFLGSAFGRITKLIFILIWYAIWTNTIEKKRKIPNLLRPKTSAFNAYLIGISLGATILLSSHFIYMWLSILKVFDVHASLSYILFNTLGVMILSSCTAILEELTFRGFLITRLEERWNIHLVIILQAILFGLLHAEQGFNMFWTTTLGGFALGYLFINTRNLYAPIAMHTSVHLLNVLYSPNIAHYLYDESPTNIFYLLGGGNLMGFVGQLGFMILTALLILRFIYSPKNPTKTINLE